MIDQVDARLRDWVGEVLDQTPVSFKAPGGQPEGSAGVGLFLFELAEAPALRNNKRPPLQLYLRYLVTTWAPRPEEAHRLLGELVFSALEREELEVDLSPIPVAVWSALGVHPSPAFVLQILLRHERPDVSAPRVRQLVTRTIQLPPQES